MKLRIQNDNGIVKVTFLDHKGEKIQSIPDEYFEWTKLNQLEDDIVLDFGGEAKFRKLLAENY